MTDKERLDWLQKQLDKAEYTGKCIFRWSETGRGMRLHETSLPKAVSSVRDAIDEAMIDEGE
jgi:hypothetical protein